MEGVIKIIKNNNLKEKKINKVYVFIYVMAAGKKMNKEKMIKRRHTGTEC